MENAKILSLIFVSELKSPNICVQEEMDRKEMNIEELNLIDETDNTVDSKYLIDLLEELNLTML